MRHVRTHARNASNSPLDTYAHVHATPPILTRLAVRASRGLYHASSDILCPETNQPSEESLAASVQGGSSSKAHGGKAGGLEGKAERPYDAQRCSLIVDTGRLNGIERLDKERMVGCV